MHAGVLHRWQGVTVTWAKYRTVVMLGANREQTKVKIAVGEKCLPCVLSVLVAGGGDRSHHGF